MEEKRSTAPMDLESTDYDVERVGDLDPRLEAGKRDAVFFHALGIACTVIATIWMYAFGTGDPAEMKYLLGMPMWVSGAILIYLAKWEEFPLTARFKKNRSDKNKGGNKA